MFRVDVEEEERDVFDVPALRQNLNLLLDMTEEGIRRNDSQVKTLKVGISCATCFSCCHSVIYDFVSGSNNCARI